jgi:hypothetical protein
VPCEYVVDFLPKVKLEIVLGDEMVDQAVDTIMRAPHRRLKDLRLQDTGTHSRPNRGIWIGCDLTKRGLLLRRRARTPEGQRIVSITVDLNAGRPIRNGLDDQGLG